MVSSRRDLTRESNELVLTLQAALQGIEWRRFYPIRIGFAASIHFEPAPLPEPAVLMVEIDPDTKDWDTAIEKALLWRSLLCKAGIPDFEVEMREVWFRPYAASAALEGSIKPEYWLRFPTSSYYDFSFVDLLLFLSHLGYIIGSGVNELEGIHPASPAMTLRRPTAIDPHIRQPDLLVIRQKVQVPPRRLNLYSCLEWSQTCRPS
jgi:hypothetical protein